MIIIIQGPAQSGKSLIANSMRNTHIGKSNPEEGVIYGAVLVDDTNDGEIKPLIEKLLIGVELPDPPPRDLSTLPWKKSPLVIVVGKKARILAEFEAALPGFAAFFGPVRTLTTDALSDSSA